ncbi:MAG: cobalamin biosynthesis central domain-containing protein [Halorhodospira sp.]
MSGTGHGLVLAAVTRGGAAQAARLAAAWPAAELIVPARLAPRLAELPNPRTAVESGALGAALGERFRLPVTQLVCFCSVGATVRLLAPYMGDKARDPGVVAVDEAGCFAVAVIGGHLGGANAWAQRVAGELGATPVVTTASDSAGLPAVDLIGREQGWRVVASKAALRRAAAALVNGEPVALVEEDDAWRPAAATPPPRNLDRLSHPRHLAADAYAAVLWVRAQAPPEEWQARLGERLVRYRPAGVGA